jgi:hypothetical protein
MLGGDQAVECDDLVVQAVDFLRMSLPDFRGDAQGFVSRLLGTGGLLRRCLRR